MENVAERKEIGCRQNRLLELELARPSPVIVQ
jgi:hypothetical protein